MNSYFGGYFGGAGDDAPVIELPPQHGSAGDGLQLFPPFTIHEAEFAVYLTDRDLDLGSLGPIFLGGRLTDLAPELTFAKMPLHRQGDPLGTTFHSDEEHRFTIGNLWVMERGSNFMPRVSRNQQYIFVVRWQDPETQTWVKRSYYGATIEGHSLLISDQTYHQKVPFTARYLDERYGYLSPPSLLPTLTGALRYVTGRERTDLYLYDFTSRTFSPAGAGVTSGRAVIVEDASKWQLEFVPGIPALRITTAGLEASELSAIGGTFPLGTVYPRVEFWIGPSRLGCVTLEGEFAVPRLTDINVEPPLSGLFIRIAINGTWAFSLGQGAAWSPSFSETLP